MRRRFDVMVVGSGHAGAEAAWAAANMLRGSEGSVAVVTLDPAKTGAMSCNPAIGGLAKGQIVREVDAMGGLMGLAADAAGINFKVLNQSKGPAVRGPRCQCDKLAYARAVRRMIESRPEIRIVRGAAQRVLIDGGRAAGVALDDGSELRARSVIITTGTFMRGLMHTGDQKTEGGRHGEAPSVGLSAELEKLGFELGRLRTGTPPRLKRGSIDWAALEPQWGDEPPQPFSELTMAGVQRDALGWFDRFPLMKQVECRITRTSPEAHELIRQNLHRAPMFNGQAESQGPRYCPSIEDKVVRFADRESHQVFLEPESHETDLVYCNGIATSTPRDVQDVIVRSMPGCASAEIALYGYTVEYDMVRPHQIDVTGETKLLPGLFLAGQINGTSGYEEAAGQGLIAGVNAVRALRDESPVRLGRDEAYIGVLMDDLATKTPTEPYRMFTSRAEHRLLLRPDNAADRLTPLGRELGLVDDLRWGVFDERERGLAEADARIATGVLEGTPLERAVKRPGFSVGDLHDALGDSVRGRWQAGVLETALAERQYAGYIDRAKAEAKRQAAMERRRIPDWLDFTIVDGLRTEARHALLRFKPATFGQASRLEGVTPVDLTVVLVAMKKGPPAHVCACDGTCAACADRA
jgi:tRNA uridine 5-carboxymethylaminomethyl modification enzyme